MKIRSLGLTLSAMLFSTAVFGAPNTFTTANLKDRADKQVFKIVNKCDKKAYFAIGAYHNEKAAWIAKGWWGVDPKKEFSLEDVHAQLEKADTSYVWLYAEFDNERSSITRHDGQLCMSQDRFRSLFFTATNADPVYELSLGKVENSEGYTSVKKGKSCAEAGGYNFRGIEQLTFGDSNYGEYVIRDCN